jgi:hypothetical protein
MRSVVITNCTGRKRTQDGLVASLASARATNLGELAQAWLTTVRSGKPTLPAGDLYVGRSVTEATFTAESLAAELFFVSAGLGLVGAHEAWPAYNLTVSTGEGSILPALSALEETTAAWWSEVNGARGSRTPLSSLLSSSSVGTVLLAVPSGYVDMIADDIGHAAEQHLHKLHIFTSSVGLASLSPALKRCAMPYDHRLEAALPGTKTDFPQRAMRHFVETLRGHCMAREEAHAAVANSMASLVAPTIPTRTKASDEEIMQLLVRNWSRHAGQSSRLLRFLRDEALIACEQGRFRDLWRRALSELECEAAHG